MLSINLQKVSKDIDTLVKSQREMVKIIKVVKIYLSIPPAGLW